MGKVAEVFVGGGVHLFGVEPERRRELDERGKSIGRVTSGTKSPSLGKSIALAYVTIEEAELDNTVDAEIRGRKISARIVSLPFYQR